MIWREVCVLDSIWWWGVHSTGVSDPLAGERGHSSTRIMIVFFGGRQNLRV